MLERFLVADRLMQLGVETSAHRLDRLEAMSAKSVLQLAHAQLHAFQPRRVDALRPVFERFVEVVESGQQPADQLGGRVLDGVDLVLARALFEVLEVRRQAQIPILGLRRARLELGDLAFERRDLFGGCGVRGLGPPLTLVGFVRVVTGSYRSWSDTAMWTEIKPRAPPYARLRSAPPLAIAPRSGCRPSSSGRSPRAPP